MMVGAAPGSWSVWNHACVIDSTGENTHTRAHTHTRDKQLKSDEHIYRRADNKERDVIGNAARD